MFNSKEILLMTFKLTLCAFAYFNSVENRVLLSRDVMGERHIFYRVIDNEFVFASEPLPILAGVKNNTPRTQLQCAKME